MSSQDRLNKAYKEAKRIAFTNTDKFILFSDCHRGDSSFADDFANNRNIYFHAMSHYFKEGYTYIELGDGDELWENMFFKTIFEANKNVYQLLQQFYMTNRLHLIYGNHDMVYRNQNVVKKNLYEYFDQRKGENVPLFPGIQCNEAIVLENKDNHNQELFLTHGHQADFMNYVGWKINRFLVRILWKPLQVWGIKDPTSPAKNYVELIKVERRIKKWIADNGNKITITGHTHRPRFPSPIENALHYFNDGSCVHPRSITGIEIVNGTIALIKWFIDTKEDGTLQIKKEFLEGPCRLEDYKS
ncbi:MAG: serine/threonine protein phosphatase [Flavobacterium sp.]|uniref:metallophosphoesterase n=1 Tax=unclassified Flavobacterium TaxID=196869 RepID=UPI000C69FDBC|nr:MULTISPECIES: metallophosphoesterase [unclassified Flavobacterium]MBF03492.1 serine/threonine protein phosphatase [Flavobacterium sp.]MCO6162059.1 metallophosphoesterase family protein [Flavobacterium sp. NRK F7]|tara:strand:- start:1649 stop:2551 length:903 start_codon:yes stop_codon:yes gene_type:complete